MVFRLTIIHTKTQLKSLMYKCFQFSTFSQISGNNSLQIPFPSLLKGHHTNNGTIFLPRHANIKATVLHCSGLLTTQSRICANITNNTMSGRNRASFKNVKEASRSAQVHGRHRPVTHQSIITYKGFKKSLWFTQFKRFCYKHQK